MESKYDGKFEDVYEILNQLLYSPDLNKEPIGFKRSNK